MLANEKMRAMYEHTAQTRVEKVAVYGKNFPVPAVVAQSPASETPTSVSSPHTTSPATPLKSSLTSPVSAGAESVVSSDGEGPTSPTFPRSASKASAKKGKKRK